MITTTKATAPSPGQPPQSSLSGGQGGANNLPVQTSDTVTTDTHMDFDLTHNGNFELRPGPPLTMEPYSPHIVDEEEIKTRRNRNKERKIKKLISLEKTFDGTPKYCKYHVITFPGVDIATKLNVILADKYLKEKIGPAKMERIGKYSIMITINSEEQKNKLYKIKEITGFPVTIEPHRTLNTIKGTTYSETMSQCSIEDLTDHLTNQNVVKIERMKRKMPDGSLIETHRYIIHFSGSRLPRVLKLAEWHHEIIEPYIPKPMRCMKCLRLGHTKKWCRREKESCMNCCQEGHTLTECENEPSCINCKGNHRPTDINCPDYKFHTEVLSTQAREHITKREATEKVKERYIEQGISFSMVVKNQPRDNNNNSNETPNVLYTRNRFETLATIPETQVPPPEEMPSQEASTKSSKPSIKSANRSPPRESKPGNKQTSNNTTTSTKKTFRNKLGRTS